MGDDGLRERKKARTREAILREAFRLFRERGYDATTIEQIAEAAEISPATFFRYFPAKEHLAALDRFPPLIEALAAQPPGAPVTVLRGAFRTAFAALSAEEIAAGHAREVFAATVPELLAANLRRSPGLIREVCETVADRAGSPADDPRIRNAVGAVFGVVAMVWLQWAQDARMDGPAEIDRALAHLETGLGTVEAPVRAEG
ncbi:TetR family transcriptional regulator [Planomonospora parontospora subsp. parontospora]|uniref:TetR family transcriptional regulator n=2 Tax=Planomonospora parontospora TaxID=58119 RepID=A0AA37BFV8_9ACTN|nr:TetR family transcriptional regulator [Planomonospora parontospora]GGK64874.1 TetR family transcriptional regulator [Planomonospora parontospora]GII08044.1 TetR family transcriptional regulator [Planomonospora parontospora subsp. parontospora]